MRKSYPKKLWRPSSRTSLVTFVFGFVTSIVWRSLGMVSKKFVTPINCSVFSWSKNSFISLSLIPYLIISRDSYLVTFSSSVLFLGDSPRNARKPASFFGLEGDGDFIRWRPVFDFYDNWSSLLVLVDVLSLMASLPGLLLLDCLTFVPRLLPPPYGKP